MTENEEKYRKLVDTSNDPIFTININGEYLFMNEAAARQLGGKPSDFHGKRLQDIFPQELAQKHLYAIREVIQNNKPWSGETITEVNGQPRWYSMNIHPVMDESGQVLYAQSVAHEITELKLAQIQLENQRKNLEGLVAERTKELDEKNLQLQEEIQEKAVVEEELRATNEDFMREIQERAAIEEELRTTNEQLKNEILKRDEVEKALLDEKNLSETIINSLPGVFFMFSSQGRLVKWNQNFEDVTGFTREEMDDRSPVDFFEGRDVELVAGRVQEVFEKGAAQLEAKLLTKNGLKTPYYFMGRLAKIHNVPYLVGHGTDISELKAIQEELSLKNLVFESSISANHTSDNNSRITHVNPAFLKLWGYKTKNEVIGRHVSDFIKDASKVDEISTALNTTGKWEGEFFALKKDGSSFIAWGQKTAVMDEDGNQIGYQSGVIDITSRKMVEEALIQSEAIQNILLNATTDTIAMIEKNGIINIINDIGAQRFGKVAGEMVGLNLFDFFPKDLLAFRKTKINSVFETGKPILFEDSRNNLNFETSVYPILNNDGEVSHVGIFATDITESKIIQEALSESEEQHRKIFESVTDAIFICDMTGGIVEVNPAASIIYGYSREEFLTMGPADLVHPDYGNELQRFFMEATAGDVFHGETVDIRKDGTYINSEVIGTTLVFQGEKHLMAIIRNITEIKKAREEVDRFFNVTSNLLCIAGVDGYFRQLNPAWEKLLGYSREELLSVPFIGFTHPDDIEPTLKEMEKLLKGAVTINFMNRWRCKDGSYKWLNWNTTSFEDTLYAAAVDITKIKKTEAEMKMLLAELERSNKELEQFAYIASHDLQEPLRMVSSFLQLLNKRYADKLGEEGHEFIHFAVDGANRMKQLIVDLLTFSRVGTKGKDFLPVNMNELLDKVKRNLQNMIKETGAVITSDNLPVIEADESQMMQLFQNLLDNAIKFRGKQKPSIRISIENHRGMFEFSISDNGIGIEERFAERIFVIFQRLHTRDEYPGTGIGLAVCKKIALRHQGDIYMVSRPGEGSIFKFTIAKNLKRLNK